VEARAPDAFVALHDATTVALWGLLTRGEGLPMDEARTRARLLGDMQPEPKERLARLAYVRPVAAMAAGLAADMLVGRDGDHAADTARAWAAFGDAPFDVIEREVLAKGLTSPRVPASPRP
jgi:hypothetical protein